jgi:nitrogen fixation protein FixH
VEETKTAFISQSNKSAMRNPWVLGWLGAITLVLVVNIAFITTAFMTNPGLVDDNYYEKGRDHERHMQNKIATRNTLGWNMHFLVPETIHAGEATTLRFSANDRNGAPLRDAVVTIQAYRPSDASADFSIEMDASAEAAGIHEQEVTLPLKGIWDLNAKVVRGEDALTISRRINVTSR